MGIRLSILDQTPLMPEETPSQAFRHTVELARLAEQLGYYRFWVSEHHDSVRVAGTSPEVLISYLLAKTERLRIGSGGVMLQHYSPYKVAENFNVLASLAPGRVDLGVGRAPGGLPRSTRALQQGVTEAASLSEKLTELQYYVTNRVPDDHPFAGIVAGPVAEQPAEIYVLGTSAASAEIAAASGLPYVYALFINNCEQTAQEAFKTYLERFQPKHGRNPQPILALSVIVADTEKEAQELARDCTLVKIKLAGGRTLTVATIEQAEEYGRQSNEEYTIETQQAQIIKGTKESVRTQLLELQRVYGIQECIVVSNHLKNAEQRMRSYTLLKEAFAEEEAAAWKQTAAERS
ncbi:LLM class flavin-dependent oxidoreductase [Paenibacillus naphthalenovorans]|uniref:LLM class flavin-dependent oxidoreductase n=1 Tax=Paenibacillus naphthalenovorans TaxID=162209 RepID=UPI000883BB14|nr:LLM class flavin-dependent oxidoreductase [Paenibacillus naphthalenovorans]SDI94789.1 luciferase family oxidoreductase, group 1 [Paenibacillus naphthalenovorans]